MRIATWNINGMKARLPFLLHWLDSRRPDLVGLQELKMVDEQFPHEALAEVGYGAVTHGQKAWNGVAVLTRGEKAGILQRGLPGQEEMGARLLAVQTGGIHFLTVYVPNGKTLEHDDYGRKLAWYDGLAEYLEREFSPDQPLVLCGDFNVCPTALDSHGGEAWEGEIFHTEAERARVQRLIDWGLVDIFRASKPDEKTFSWWDYRGGSFYRNKGLRIDFLLATEAVRARTREVVTDRDYRKKKDDLSASDHAPVMADLA
jgi:exodeoxyribonuclease-3